MTHGRACAAVLSLALAGVCACGLPAPPPDPKPDAEHSVPGPPPGNAPIRYPSSAEAAQRYLFDEKIFAPWGVGLGGPPVPAYAISVILEQENAPETLERVFWHSAMPGRLLALCGIRSVDRDRFDRLARQADSWSEEVLVGEGCLLHSSPAKDIVEQMATTDECTQFRENQAWLEKTMERFR